MIEGFCGLLFISNVIYPDNVSRIEQLESYRHVFDRQCDYYHRFCDSSNPVSYTHLTLPTSNHV